VDELIKAWYNYFNCWNWNYEATR